MGIALEPAAAGILPVEIDAIKHRVGTQEVDHRLGKDLPLTRRIEGARNISRQGPAADRNAGAQVGVKRLELADLVEIAPDLLTAAGILSGVRPAVSLTTHGIGGIGKAFLSGRIAVKERHATTRIDLGKGVDEMGEPISRHSGNRVVTSIDAPLGEVGRHDRRAHAGDGAGAEGHGGSPGAWLRCW